MQTGCTLQLTEMNKSMTVPTAIYPNGPKCCFAYLQTHSKRVHTSNQRGAKRKNKHARQQSENDKVTLSTASGFAAYYVSYQW